MVLQVLLWAIRRVEVMALLALCLPTDGETALRLK